MPAFLTPAVMGRLKGVDAAALCDAARRLGALNAVQTMQPAGLNALRPQHQRGRGVRLVGTAQTTECLSEDFGAVVEGLKTCDVGDVLVAVAAGDRAIAGELFTAECQRRGLGGLVVAGSVRDTSHLLRMEFPVYSTGVNPFAGAFAEPGRQGATVQVAGVVVNPGDLLFGDDDGLISLGGCRADAGLLEELLGQAEEIISRETTWLRKMQQEGVPLLDLVGSDSA